MAVTITGKPSSLHCGPNLQIILKDIVKWLKIATYLVQYNRD